MQQEPRPEEVRPAIIHDNGSSPDQNELENFQIHPPTSAITPSEYKMPRRLKIQLILGGIALFLVTFLLGIIFTIFMQLNSFDDGPLSLVQKPILEASHIPPDAHKQWLDFNQTFYLVDKYFFEQEKVNHAQMLYSAAQAAVTTLGDPFTQFVPPEESKGRQADISGQRVGIGITSQYNDAARNISISEVYENSPAERAGLKAGDIFQKVDSQPVVITGDAGKDLDQLRKQLQGNKGTKVVLTMQRPSDNNRVLDIEVTRGDFIQPSVAVKMLPGNIGYIRVTIFGENTVKEFDQRVKGLIDGGATGLVLDLRNNGGGLTNTAQSLLARFLDGGVAYYTDVPYQDIKFRPENVAENKDGLHLFNIPLTVLVNQGSASATEITAGALQDRGRATLVGQKTFGKGIAQYVLPLVDGSTARITFEKWFTPNKHDINKQGLTPDVTVDMTQDDVNNGRDPQLDRAVKLLQDKQAAPVS